MGLNIYQELIVLHIAQNLLKVIWIARGGSKDENWFVPEDRSHGLDVLLVERLVLQVEEGNQDIPASVIGRAIMIRDHDKTVKKFSLSEKVE